MSGIRIPGVIYIARDKVPNNRYVYNLRVILVLFQENNHLFDSIYKLFTIFVLSVAKGFMTKTM